MLTWSLPLLILVLLAVVLWFWAIFDVSRCNFKNQKNKMLFFFFILVAPILGSIIYFQIKKSFISKEKKSFKPNFNTTS
ncbi:PLDc N-terminal domain-containing protein [Polaribacter sp. P097]|uniref:PLDc N-terminal domain-containing protein n=1 Tax=Polaribacter sp. P097 TaxID=3117398 RepID=UPI002FE364F6